LKQSQHVARNVEADMRISIVICLLSIGVVSSCQRKSANLAAAAAVPTTPAQDTVAWAQARYDGSVFDTIHFASDSARNARGADVFRWACASCHGPGGKGNGGAVVNGVTLRPPSFVEPGWRFAHDEDGLRRKIFVGNTQGMPHWGLRHTQPRDILAVEKYILEGLRGAQ
jgi:mono/diheme cytochrome c family protein